MTGTTLAAMDYLPRALLKYLASICSAPLQTWRRSARSIARRERFTRIRAEHVLTRVIDGQKAAPIPTR